MIPVVAAQYKLVLVGDSAVGKSSLLSQFVDGKYDEHLLSTIGVDFKFRRVKIGNEQIKLQIWDTAGQETFRSIVSAYYNSADAILLCYDISSYDSFENVKDYWLPEALNNNKNNAKLFVVGNKVDSKKQVQSFSLQALKNVNNIAGFFQVSAKMNTNVESTFINIAKSLHSGRPLAASNVDTRPKKNNLKQNAVKLQEGLNQGEATQGKKKCCS